MESLANQLQSYVTQMILGGVNFGSTFLGLYVVEHFGRRKSLRFATTWGPIIWTICAELYPSRYRSNAMALATASNWGWNFLLAFFTPFIVGDIDFLYGYVFAGCLFVSAVVVYFFVIESQGRTLEEIDTMYIIHVNPRKSSSWVAPPPEELITTERLVRGEFSGAGADLEQSNSVGARAEETAVSPTADHSE